MMEAKEEGRWYSKKSNEVPIRIFGGWISPQDKEL